MHIVDLIKHKRDGNIFNTTEIEWFIQQYTQGKIADYQAAAWLMAVYLCGMNAEETPAVAPLVAACGVAVGKMSGRGLGHTGGTIDKLESVTGFRAELSRADFLSILRQHQIVLAGQSND